MKRKLLAILTSALLLCAMLPLGSIPVTAATSGTTGKCTWTLDDDGHLTISGNGKMEDYDFYPSRAPWGTDITSVTIEEGVTTIGDQAFINCKSLESATISDSVIAIGYRAFSACTSLTSVTIGDSVTTIGEMAFHSCTSLTSVTIPNSVTTIGEMAFYYCTSLTSITIPDGVTAIGEDAFLDCSALTAIEVGENNLDYCDVDGVLYSKDMTQLLKYPDQRSGTAYIIPDGVTIIKNNAFYNCRSLTSVIISDGVTAIGNRAFMYCTSLMSVTIPDSVTVIGLDAFIACHFESVTIPDSVERIGGSAFLFCRWLTAIDVDANNPNYSSVDGVLFNKEQTTLIKYPGGKSDDYTIPNSVTTIDGDAFCCTSLKSVSIPDSVATIEWNAFSNCRSLTDIYYGGTETDRANIAIDSQNDPLLNATWHYNCINPKNKYNATVTHSVMDTDHGNGLAFRFELLADGVTMKNRTEADLSNATVNYLGTDCKLVGMGAVVTNSATIGETAFTHADANGYDVIDVPTVYLQEADEDSCAFAIRIIDIPDTAMERTLYARPYYVVEVDSEQITVYGDVDTASCAAYM